MAMVHGSDVLKWGNTPGIEFMRRLGYWLDRKMDSDELFSTDSLPACWKAAEVQKESACGILALRIPVVTGGASTRAFMIWFRPELVSKVHWAGNPEKAVVSNGSGLRLSPRSSFDKWVEQVHLKSQRWTEQETDATERFRVEYVRYCMLQQEDLIRENLRCHSIQQGKLEVAIRVLHDIGSILSGVRTKIASNRAKSPWVETLKLVQLRDLIIQNQDGLEAVLGAGKGKMLQRFGELMVESLHDRENEIHRDFGSLAKLVEEVEHILAVQWDSPKSGSVRLVHELVLAEVVQQAVQLTFESSQEKKVQLSVRIQRGILVRADETKLVRVLMQCIRICIDAISEAEQDFGVIDIRAVVIPGTALMSRYEMLLRISHNGAGLSQDVQREIGIACDGEARPVSTLAHHILACRDVVRSSGGTLSFESSSDGRVCIQTISMPCAMDMEVEEGFNDGDRDVV
jgi:light-regulated signal transduction histidine kinase (bacteriophytochrome)